MNNIHKEHLTEEDYQAIIDECLIEMRRVALNHRSLVYITLTVKVGETILMNDIRVPSLVGDADKAKSTTMHHLKERLMCDRIEEMLAEAVLG